MNRRWLSMRTNMRGRSFAALMVLADPSVLDRCDHSQASLTDIARPNAGRFRGSALCALWK